MFRAEAVGYASAAVSAFSLLGTVGVFGLGTLLMWELPRAEGRRLPLFSAAVWAAAVLSGVAGLVFGVGAWLVAPSFARYTVGAVPLAIFVLGVSLTGAGIVVDNGLVGMLRGKIQLWRNIAFSVIKLALLAGIAPLFADSSTTGAIAAWVIGLAGSFLVIAPVVGRSGLRELLTPRFKELKGLGRSAMTHHWLNLLSYAPRFGMPLIVTGLMSARANASFYAAWLIVSVAYIVPTHLSIGLFTVTSNHLEALGGHVKLTLAASLAAGVVQVAILLSFAHPLMSLFGPSYVSASGVLQILAWGYFGNAIRSVGIAVHRVRRQEGRAIRILAIGGVLEIGAAVLGVRLDGLHGLAECLLVAFMIEALLMIPAIVRAVQPAQKVDSGVSGLPSS
jgi:O-antigen/teichoic acid export membrane protein